MKKIFAIFCAVVLIPGMNAQAWVGGPWSNNSPLESGDDGVYEAVATATNGSGLYRWAVGNQTISTADAATADGGGGAGGTQPSSANVLFGAGLLATASSNVWYYQGVTYYGRAFGTVNSAMGIVSVIGNGTALVNDETINAVPVTESTEDSGGIDVEVTEGVFFDTILVTARPQLYPATCNSQFTCKLRNSGVDAPAKRFSGSGTVSFVGEPSSIRVVSFNFFSDENVDVTIDGSATSGEDAAEFDQVGHKAKFKVMGSQVSTAVIP